MQVFLVNKTTGEYEELEPDCKVVLDLGIEKTIELDVASQLVEGDTVNLTIIGGKPAAKLKPMQADGGKYEMTLSVNPPQK